MSSFSSMKQLFKKLIKDVDSISQHFELQEPTCSNNLRPSSLKMESLETSLSSIDCKKARDESNADTARETKVCGYSEHMRDLKKLVNMEDGAEAVDVAIQTSDKTDIVSNYIRQKIIPSHKNLHNTKELTNEKANELSDNFNDKQLSQKLTKEQNITTQKEKLSNMTDNSHQRKLQAFRDIENLIKFNQIMDELIANVHLHLYVEKSENIETNKNHLKSKRLLTDGYTRQESCISANAEFDQKGCKQMKQNKPKLVRHNKTSLLRQKMSDQWRESLKSNVEKKSSSISIRKSKKH